MAIEDIIKGALYPMRSAISLATVAMVIVGIALIFELLKKIGLKIDLSAEKKYYIEKEAILLRWLIGITFSTVMVSSVLMNNEIKLSKYYNSSILGNSLGSLAHTMPFFSLAFALFTYRLINVYVNDKNNQLMKLKEQGHIPEIFKIVKKSSVDKKNIESKAIYSSIIEYVSIGLFFYFLTSAATLGILNSENITRRNDYDYVTDIKPTLMPGRAKKRVIYLGTISKNILFTDSLMLSYFVVNKDSVPSLHIHHVDALAEQIRLSRIPCDCNTGNRRSNR